MKEQVSLDLYCPKCHGALTVQCVDWVQGGEHRAAMIACPYCRAAFDGGLPACGPGHGGR